MKPWGIASRVVALCAIACAAVACVSDRSSAPEQRLAATALEIIAPVTITLSTPNLVSPLAPVLLGANQVQLGGSASVVQGTTVAMGSGGVITQPDAHLNDTWSAGPVSLGDRTKVTGTLHAASIAVGSSVTIGASDVSPPIFPPQSFAWKVQFPSGTGASYTINAGQAQSLSPGLYGSVTMNSQSQLNLSSGTYYFTDLLLLNSAAVVSLNQTQGPVVIYVLNSIALRGAFIPQSADGGTSGAHPDLLIAYLGTSPVFIESLYDGAFVAPQATLTLRAATGGIHTGYFEALNVNNLDAAARVQYRAPLAIVTASGITGTSCEALVASTVSASQVASALARYCNTCGSTADSDHDGIADCADRCPSDPLKTSPGMCGCGLPEVDTDGDGVPDCIDQCPQDPNNVTPGECGCVGDSTLQPAGVSCTDPACPQAGSTCNGSGVCGNRAACSPGSNCRYVSWNYHQYWVCGEPLPVGGGGNDGGANDGGTPAGALPQPGATTACGAKGLHLLRVDSLQQNRVVDQFLTTPLWLGATTASQRWAWINNGDVFWSGGATGSPVANRFSNWAGDAPGTQSCAAMLPFDGHWVDVACNESLGYVCTYDVPFNVGPDGGALGHPVPPGISHQPVHAPDAGACVPESSLGLPGTLDELENQIDAGRHRQFIGAAANPPPDGSTCADESDPLSEAIGRQPDAGIGCAFVNIVNASDCLSDNDCHPGFICRPTQQSPTCLPPDASPGTFVAGSSCPGHMKCGQLVCPSDNLPCNLIEVCNPGTTFDAGLDDGSTLTPHPFDPATLFGGLIPDASASDAYADPPLNTGVDHAWCHMTPNAVADAAAPTGQLHGQSGGGSKLSFSFDPDLIFDVQANPLALGETKLHLEAAGSLNASFTLKDFVGQDFTGSILSASIGIVADRCSLDDVDTTFFRVFGVDAIDPFSFGIPKINTLDPTLDANVAKVSADCNDAVGTFLLWADRAKKAFRDAQQLLSQYHNLKAASKNFSNDLCDALGIATAIVPNFPGGNVCEPGETPELTINRFIDYYQGPGTGQIDELRNAFLGPNGLSAVTDKLINLIHVPSLNKQFGLVDQEESATILEVPFAIGPVPMLLEVDVFAGYGVDGNLDLSLKFPLSLDSNDLDKIKPIARAGASVVPHAYAGLSAFVGAGFDFGALSAEVGIEGAVTLADIKVPVFAGAELDIAATRDLRPIPADIGPPVSLVSSLTHFGIPTAFKFFVNYDYGIAVDLDDILKGELDAKLHISFFFFSRTWRKQIVHFNGFSENINIINGGSNNGVSTVTQMTGSPNGSNGSANVASGSAPMGLSEPQVPLMVLAYLPVNGAPPPGDAGIDASDAGTAEFDASNVQSVFYDNQCCLKAGALECSTIGAPQCCPGSTCVVPDSGPLRISQCVANTCQSFGVRCAQNSDCCSGFCSASGRCGSACGAAGTECGTSADCCSGLQCASTSTCVPICTSPGNACVFSSDCCAGVCSGGFCGSSPPPR